MPTIVFLSGCSNNTRNTRFFKLQDPKKEKNTLFSLASQHPNAKRNIKIFIASKDTVVYSDYFHTDHFHTDSFEKDLMFDELLPQPRKERKKLKDASLNTIK